MTDQCPFLFRSIYRCRNSRAEALQPHRKANMFQSEDHGPQALLRATKQWSPGVREIHHSCRCADQVLVLVFLHGTWGYTGLGKMLQRAGGGVAKGVGERLEGYRGMGTRLQRNGGRLQRGGGGVTERWGMYGCER